MIKYLKSLIVILLFASFTLYGTLKSFYNNKIKIESFIYEVKPNSSILDLYNGIYESNNFFEKSLFLIGIYIFDFRTIQAGEYLIDDSLFKVLTKMKLGETITYKFVINDGTNKFDLSLYIDTLKLNNDCKDFSCIDLINNSIEGLLLPDTYFYKKDTNLSLLLNKSSTELKNYVDMIWIDKPIDNPLKSRYEAIILASIIEKESSTIEEKMKIGGVFLHRLKIKMKLQADPTIIYGLMPDFNGDITKKDLRDKNNLYNTYVINSLPPTPISMPTKSSLDAAILNSPNEYLFFVADGEGKHIFSKTYNEHLEYVNRYQKNENY